MAAKHSKTKRVPHLYRVRVLVFVERLADLRRVDLDFFSGVSTVDGRHVGKLIGKRRFGLHDVARFQGCALLNDLTK